MFEHHTQEHYSILGVAPTATRDEIRKAWREAAKFWHPDRNDRPEATSKLKQLNVAWDVLSDPQRRAQYDALLSAGVFDGASAASGAGRAGGNRSGGYGGNRARSGGARGGSRGGGQAGRDRARSGGRSGADTRWSSGQTHNAGYDGWSRTQPRERPRTSGSGYGYGSDRGNVYGYDGYGQSAGAGAYSGETAPDFVRMWNALKLEANLREGRAPDYPGVTAAPRVIGFSLLFIIVLGSIGAAFGEIGLLIGAGIGLLMGIGAGINSASRAEHQRIARATGYPAEVIAGIHARAKEEASRTAWSQRNG